MSELKVSLLNRRLFCGIVLIFAAVLAVAHPYRAFLTESGGSVEGPAWMAVFIYGVSSERTLLFLPLFVPLGAAGDVQEELKSRYAVFLVSRAGKKNYLAGKILGAALCGGCEQTCRGFQGVDGQLRMEDASGRGKYIRILALFPLDEVTQEHSGHHGRRHAPFLEPGGDG